MNPLIADVVTMFVFFFTAQLIVVLLALAVTTACQSISDQNPASESLRMAGSGAAIGVNPHIGELVKAPAMYWYVFASAIVVSAGDVSAADTNACVVKL